MVRISVSSMILAGFAAWALAPVARASTGTDPVVDPGPVAADGGWIGLPVSALAAIVGAAALVKLWPRLRGRIAAAAIVTASLIVGVVAVLVAIFSDFSGRGQIAWPVVIAAVGVVTCGLAASRRVLRR